MSILKEIRDNGAENRIQQWCLDSGFHEDKLASMFGVSRDVFRTMLKKPRERMTVKHMEVMAILANTTPLEVFDYLRIWGKGIREVKYKGEMSLLLSVERERDIHKN